MGFIYTWNLFSFYLSLDIYNLKYKFKSTFTFILNLRITSNVFHISPKCTPVQSYKNLVKNPLGTPFQSGLTNEIGQRQMRRIKFYIPWRVQVTVNVDSNETGHVEYDSEIHTTTLTTNCVKKIYIVVLIITTFFP